MSTQAVSWKPFLGSHDNNLVEESQHTFPPFFRTWNPTVLVLVWRCSFSEAPSLPCAVSWWFLISVSPKKNSGPNRRPGCFHDKIKASSEVGSPEPGRMKPCQKQQVPKWGNQRNRLKSRNTSTFRYSRAHVGFRSEMNHPRPLQTMIYLDNKKQFPVIICNFCHLQTPVGSHTPHSKSITSGFPSLSIGLPLRNPPCPDAKPHPLLPSLAWENHAGHGARIWWEIIVIVVVTMVVIIRVIIVMTIL